MASQSDSYDRSAHSQERQRHHRHHRHHRRHSSPMHAANSAVPVGVDVTAHREERRLAVDPAQAARTSNQRVRYYVELVVGSPHASHRRLGFAGTFKALLRLHQTFEALLHERYGHESGASLAVLPLRPRGGVSSPASVSASTSSASSDMGGPTKNQEASSPPQLPVFPAKHAASRLLVRLAPQHAENEAKAEERTDALFAYYTQTFNSPEQHVFLEYIQAQSEGQHPQQPEPEDRASASVDEDEKESKPARREHGGGRFSIRSLFSRDRGHGTDTSSTVPGHQSERKRRSEMDSKLEFLAPVYVRVRSKSGQRRKSKA